MTLIKGREGKGLGGEGKGRERGGRLKLKETRGEMRERKGGREGWRVRGRREEIRP